jgi:purine-nucleoside phosphorylase
VVFPVRVLVALGVRKLLVTNAAGAVNAAYVPGDFMVITDHLNLTGQNPLRGINDDRVGPRFPDLSTAYAKSGQQALREAGRQYGLKLREGVYAGLTGPSYETPAEIRMLRTLGADAVGMSTVPEVITAVHAGLSVAALSVITNRAAGLSDQPLSHDEVKEVADRVKEPLCNVLAAAVKRWV